VHEENKANPQGEHGARSAKQAIAIGLSEARRAGVKLKPHRGRHRVGRDPQNAVRESKKVGITRPCRPPLAAIVRA